MPIQPTPGRLPALLPALLTCALGVGGCRERESALPVDGIDRVEAQGVVQARRPGTPAESATVRMAEARLAAWLDASREPGPAEGTSPSGSPNACDDGGVYFPSPLLASFTLLPSELRGDTVVARVAVITVAEQDVERRAQQATSPFVARQRVRRETLEWDVVPAGDDWSVCNGIRFGYRGADSLTRWMPDGASITTARALADSIAQADARAKAMTNADQRP